VLAEDKRARERLTRRAQTGNIPASPPALVEGQRVMAWREALKHLDAPNSKKFTHLS
jgi:hypothetical protein